MAVFNAEKTIERSIKSVINQTLIEWELIVIDDCSMDKTFDILKVYATRESRIQIYRNIKNSGLAESLNKGIIHATTPLIARMDDDDEMLPYRLERQVSFMDENPNVGVLGSGAYLIDKRGQALGLSLQPEKHAEIYKVIRFRNPMMHPTVVMRKSLLLEDSYLPKLRRKQDYELWSRLIKKTLFHNLQEPLIRYSANYKKPLSTILWGLYVTCLVALRLRSPLGLFNAFIRFITSILVKLSFYTPTSVRQQMNNRNE